MSQRIALTLLLLLAAAPAHAQSPGGTNTFDMPACAGPAPFVLALASTPTQDGVVVVPAGGAEAFALAAVNAGAEVSSAACGGWTPLGPFPGSRRWTTYVVTPESDAPVTLSVCATNPATGACAAPPKASVEAGLGTFTVFVTAVGPVPGGSRIAVRFEERQWVHEDTIPTDFSIDLGTRVSVSVEVRVLVP